MDYENVLLGENNIMIRLKNIQKNDNIVQCDIFSEDSESEGILVFDIIADAVKKYCLPELIMWV